MRAPTLIALLLLAACASAPPPPPPGGGMLRPTSSFNDVVERGARLAAYQRATTRGAIAAAKELKPPAAGQRRYAIVVPRGGDMNVRVGELDAAKKNFLVAAEVAPSGDGSWLAGALVPPRAEPGFTAAAARAIETAQRSLPPEQRLSVTVVPAGEQKLYVYFSPEPARPGEASLGPDWRFLVSPDGNKLLDTLVMHRSETQVKLTDQGKKITSFTHSHPDEELQDTDVAFSIAHAVGEVILLQSKGAFILDEYGVPNYFTETEMARFLSRQGEGQPH